MHGPRIDAPTAPDNSYLEVFERLVTRLTLEDMIQD